jgi:hypothetical protein
MEGRRNYKDSTIVFPADRNRTGILLLDLVLFIDAPLFKGT